MDHLAHEKLGNLMGHVKRKDGWTIDYWSPCGFYVRGLACEGPRNFFLIQNKERGWGLQWTVFT